SPHAVHELVRNSDAWNLVGHKLSISYTFERKDPSHDRQPRSVDALQKAVEIVEVENWTRHHELGTSLDLVVEPPQLFIDVRRRWVNRDPDVKRRRRTDGLAADIAAVIQP